MSSIRVCFSVTWLLDHSNFLLFEPGEGQYALVEMSFIQVVIGTTFPTDRLNYCMTSKCKFVEFTWFSSLSKSNVTHQNLSSTSLYASLKC